MHKANCNIGVNSYSLQSALKQKKYALEKHSLTCPYFKEGSNLL